MNPPAGYRRESPDGHPPYDAPAYASTHKRAPRHAPIRLEHTLSEITGPRFERDQLAPGDDDMTARDAGAELFEAAHLRRDLGSNLFRRLIVSEGDLDWHLHNNTRLPE